MKIPTILLTASAAILVGCEEVPPPPPPPPAAPAAVVVPPGQPAIVVPARPVSLTTATKAPFGTYLVDAAGRSLYILEGTRGESGTSRCTPDCLQVWPPLHGAPATAGAGVNAALLATTPLHGESHVTYSGWPLYYYSHDRASGDTTGQDVHDRWGVWHLLSPSGAPIRPAGAAY